MSWTVELYNSVCLETQFLRSSNKSCNHTKNISQFLWIFFEDLSGKIEHFQSSNHSSF